MASYKAKALYDRLIEELKIRLASMTFTEAVDTDGYPWAIISQDATPVAGERVFVLKVMAQSWPLVKDALGNDQTVYTPSVIKVCVEKSAGENMLTVHEIGDILTIFACSTGTGALFEVYRSANGAVPALAEMTAAQLEASFESLYWPLKSSS